MVRFPWLNTCLQENIAGVYQRAVLAGGWLFSRLLPAAVVLLGSYKSQCPLAAREGALAEASECSEVALYGQISMVE